MRIPRKISTHFCQIPRIFGIAHGVSAKWFFCRFDMLRTFSTHAWDYMFQRILVDLSWLLRAYYIGLYTNRRKIQKDRISSEKLPRKFDMQLYHACMHATSECGRAAAPGPCMELIVKLALGFTSIYYKINAGGRPPTCTPSRSIRTSIQRSTQLQYRLSSQFPDLDRSI